MASATMIKYPDGRTEQKNVLSHFVKNGTNIIVFETEKVDNNHKVVGVSYLEDGMYQNIVDANKWNEVKHDLVDVLHDNISMDEYKVVPEEISVTIDPYHPIALREENYDKLVSSYEQFKNSIAINQPSPVSENNSTIDLSTTEPVQAVTTPVEPAPVDTQVKPDIVTPVENEKVVDPFAIVDALEQNATTPEIHQDIVPPMDTPVIADAPVVDSTPNVLDGQPAPEITESPATLEFNNLVNEEVVYSPVINNEPVVSPVQETYENRTTDIIKEMRELSENYLKKMEEMSAEISRNLEEARGINELAKQTLDKAQTVMPITNENTLELTRAA
jgi:hypothetical protein